MAVAGEVVVFVAGHGSILPRLGLVCGSAQGHAVLLFKNFLQVSEHLRPVALQPVLALGEGVAGHAASETHLPVGAHLGLQARVDQQFAVGAGLLRTDEDGITGGFGVGGGHGSIVAGGALVWGVGAK